MEEKNNFLRWFYLLILSLVWGSSFILMKRGLMSFTPGQVAAMRMVISCMVLLPFILHQLKNIPKKSLKYVAATGLLGNGIPAFLFTHAETGISSSMAGMLNSLTSVFTLIIGYFFFSTAFTKRHLAGVTLGLIGAVALLWLSAGDADSAQPWKGSYVLIATVCYAFSVNILRNKLSDINALTLTGAALLFVGPPCGIYLFSTDFIHRFSVDDTAFLNAFFVFLLAFLGTAVSTVIFNHLIRISSALYASSVTYLIPFIAVLWGIYDGETFNIMYLLALVIILLGIYLINYKSRKSNL